MAKNFSGDLQDSRKDQERLKPDKATIDLPDVKDIPGQENVHVPKLREMHDTTISSDDEEGAGIWDNDEADEDPSNDSLGPAQRISEDDLKMNDDNLKLEAKLDEEDVQADDSALDITTDSSDPDSDVTADEKAILEKGTDNMDTPDNEDLYRSELDDTDFDGEKLNEAIEVSGDDLDVPGSEDDDENEAIGEEDEENNSYSLGDTE